MVSAIFNFLYNQENLLRETKYNRNSSASQNLYKTMGDSEPLKMNKLERFVVIVRKNKDFLTHI